MIKDQAFQLREMKQSIHDNRDVSRKKRIRKPIIYAVTSGKGGVGKTSISLNLAISCATLGKKVLLIDSDLNLASLDVLMGIAVRKSLSDTVLKNRKVSDVIIKTPFIVDLIPGYSGIVQMMDMDEVIRDKIFNQLSILEREYDYVFIDTGAGIGNNVLNFIDMAQESIVVVTPEPASIMDAYAVIKLLNIRGSCNAVSVITNMMSSCEEARDIFKKLKLVVDKFLNFDIQHLGYITRDKMVGNAVKIQKPFVASFPKSSASLCIKAISKRLVQNDKRRIEEVNVSFFDKVKNSVKELV